MKQLFFPLVYIILLFVSCESIEPPIERNETEWNLVSGLENLDVRYMIEFQGDLFLSANDPYKNYNENRRGLILKTSDGLNWNIVKTFTAGVGPLTVNSDTLYVILADSIFAYTANTGWWGRFETPPRLADPNYIGDIIFYNGNLYGMQSFSAIETWCIYPDGTYEEKKVYPLYERSYAGSKFIKKTENGTEKIYVRPHWLAPGFFSFNGEKFNLITDGLTYEEAHAGESPPNSMALHNNELYAGFLNPSTVKKLVSNRWETVTDSLPYSASAYDLKPIIKTHTTGIAFVQNRLFVSTQVIGVLEWKNSKWERLTTKGLPVGYIDELPDLYVPIPIFCAYKGRLFAAYGKPGYAPYPNDVFGLYSFEVN